MTVLFIIMIVDIFAIGLVMWLGTRHDHHHDIQAVDSSEAVKRLRSKYGPPTPSAVSETPKTDAPSPQSE